MYGRHQDDDQGEGEQEALDELDLGEVVRHRVALRPRSRRRSSTSRSRPIPRDALTRTTSPSRSRATSASRAASTSRDADDPRRVEAGGDRAIGDPAGSAPTTTSQSTVRAAASPTTRWPSSLASPSSSISPRTATRRPGSPAEQVERRDHRARRGVVGVVDERHRPETHERHPMRRGPATGEPRGDLVERQAGERDRPPPPASALWTDSRPRVGIVIGRRVALGPERRSACRRARPTSRPPRRHRRRRRSHRSSPGRPTGRPSAGRSGRPR